MDYKFAVFAVGEIGIAAINIFKDCKEKLKVVVLDEDNFWNMNDEIIEVLNNYKDTKIIYYKNDEQIIKECNDIDLVLLAFWGKIIKGKLLDLPKYGFINLHTSLLPYGKGKHAHYWAIVEGTKFGVTIMKIDGGLDTGTILWQKEIYISKTDTGKSLYYKAINELKKLIDEKKERIISIDYEEIEQVEKGTFHLGKEIEENSLIDLNKLYRAEDLINILRARTFYPFPASLFEYNGEKYEIRVEINKIDNEYNKKDIDYKKIVQEIRNMDK